MTIIRTVDAAIISWLKEKNYIFKPSLIIINSNTFRDLSLEIDKSYIVKDGYIDLKLLTIKTNGCTLRVIRTMDIEAGKIKVY